MLASLTSHGTSPPFLSAVYRLFGVQLLVSSVVFTCGACQRGSAASAVVDSPQTEETDGRRAGGTSCIGDDVAMGGVSVGGSWWQGKSAVVHRVNPVEGEEWVLVIDWVAVQE